MSSAPRLSVSVFLFATPMQFAQPSPRLADTAPKIDKHFLINYLSFCSRFACIRAAASQWIGTLPPGETRNGAIFYLVDGIRAADPSSAFRWASSVEGDDDKRLYLLKQATDSWRDFAPAEARAAIEALTLSPGDRAALLRRIRG